MKKELEVGYLPPAGGHRKHAVASMLADEPWGWGDMAYSEDLRHRYTLAVHFEAGLMFGPRRRVAFVMLNPSTAWGEPLDPTVRRCAGYAKRWGYDSVAIVNLFSLRATFPDDLHAEAAGLVLRAGMDGVLIGNRHGDAFAVEAKLKRTSDPNSLSAVITGDAEWFPGPRDFAPSSRGFSIRPGGSIRIHAWDRGLVSPANQIELMRGHGKQKAGYSFFPGATLVTLKEPAVLEPGDPTGGEENTMAIAQVCSSADLVVVAWGSCEWAWKLKRPGSHDGRALEVASMLLHDGHDLQCLGRNKDGSPRHPLYLAANQELQEWRP